MGINIDIIHIIVTSISNGLIKIWKWFNIPISPLRNSWGSLYSEVAKTDQTAQSQAAQSTTQML